MIAHAVTANGGTGSRMTLGFIPDIPGVNAICVSKCVRMTAIVGQLNVTDPGNMLITARGGVMVLVRRVISTTLNFGLVDRVAQLALGTIIALA